MRKDTLYGVSFPGFHPQAAKNSQGPTATCHQTVTRIQHGRDEAEGTVLHPAHLPFPCFRSGLAPEP